MTYLELIVWVSFGVGIGLVLYGSYWFLTAWFPTKWPGIMRSVKRFEAWHRSWKSYKEPKHIRFDGLSARLRKHFPSDRDVGIEGKE